MLLQTLISTYQTMSYHAQKIINSISIHLSVVIQISA